MLYGMFFLMSFALVHGYGDSPQAAGLRLAVIPVALGIVAPFSGALSDRFGRAVAQRRRNGGLRRSLVILLRVQADPTASRHFIGVTPLFALFGAGLGVFIAPNNQSTINAAPGGRSGEAGGCSISCACLAPASASRARPWCCHGDWRR